MTIVRVIGCGNPDAGDDAAGIVAVELARDDLGEIPGVDVHPRAAPLDIVHLLDDADAVIVVDAIRSPGAAGSPGTIVRAAASPDGFPSEIRSSLSSHGFGVLEAFGLARAVGRVPELVLLGIEAQETIAGAPMSRAVGDAVPDLATAIVREARTLASQAEGATDDGPSDPPRGARPEPR